MRKQQHSSGAFSQFCQVAESPGAAAKLIGNRVVQSSSIDIGIAVEAEDGIMVPVIRTADETSLADLTTKYKELVDLARKRRISPDMQAGGIATVSNFGTFGMEWGTPIPLPDQTLVPSARCSARSQRHRGRLTCYPDDSWLNI